MLSQDAGFCNTIRILEFLYQLLSNLAMGLMILEKVLVLAPCILSPLHSSHKFQFHVLLRQFGKEMEVSTGSIYFPCMQSGTSRLLRRTRILKQVQLRPPIGKIQFGRMNLILIKPTWGFNLNGWEVMMISLLQIFTAELLQWERQEFPVCSVPGSLTPSIWITNLAVVGGLNTRWFILFPLNPTDPPLRNNAV